MLLYRMETKEFNLEESFGYYFTSITVTIKRWVEERLKPYDLTHLQFSILMNLYKNNIDTQKELLQYVYGDEASITRLIDRLQTKGYIERVPSTQDRRKKTLKLTDEGHKLMNEIIQYPYEINQELVKELSTQESQEFLRLLQKVHSSIDEK